MAGVSPNEASMLKNGMGGKVPGIEYFWFEEGGT
jgi:hypothetical protein